MGCEFPEHHGSGGGGGFGMVLLVFLVAIVASAAITPIVGAITMLIHVLMIAIPVFLAAVVALGVYRVRHGRPAFPRISWRSTAALPRYRERPELEQQQGGAVHLHIHGASGDDIAAALRLLPQQGHPELRQRRD